MAEINTYKIKISGLNLHTVLDFFERENIYARKIKRPDKNCMICTLTYGQYKFFINQPISKLYKIEILQETGFKKVFKLLTMHTGIILGIVACILSYFCFFYRIQKVVIAQENHICQNNQECIFTADNLAKLQKMLENYGLKEGKPIPFAINTKDIEHSLMLEFAQISGVTINIKGAYVFIDITEAQLPQAVISEDLTAPVSGIIISNYVTSGKCLVENGDIVTKGQTLVEKTNDHEIVAQFEIRTFYHDNLIYDQNQSRYVKTGKKITKNDISLFGIYFKSNPSINFQYYQTETASFYQSLNMLLPIKITSTTYYELAEIKDNIPYEQIQDTLKSELYQKTLNLVDTNATIRNTTYATITEGSRTRLDCYIEAIYEFQTK